MIKNLIRNFLSKRQYVKGNVHRNDRTGALHRAWGHVFTNRMRGDYVEFGVYQGASFTTSFHNFLEFKKWNQAELESLEKWRSAAAIGYQDYRPVFHGLDTFAGMPKNTEDEKSFAAGTFLSDIEGVRNLCIKNKMPESQFVLYQGLFENTVGNLQKKIQDKVVIANIDSDLYGSAVTALQSIEPFLQVGTVLLFDDYNAFCSNENKGERRAFREFKEHSSFCFEPWFSYLYSGQTFLCVDKKAAHPKIE